MTTDPRLDAITEHHRSLPLEERVPGYGHAGIPAGDWVDLINDECPVEAVFGPDDRVPCLLGRGHDGPHQYDPESCGQCDCLPNDPRCGSCDEPGCPCSEAEDEECE